MLKVEKLMVILALTGLIAGCSVEPFAGSSEPNGSLYVTTTDNSGTEIIGATIHIDGVTRVERTPSYVHGVSVGMHEIVLKYYGFWNDSAMVDITPGDTANLSSALDPVPADQVGYLRVNSTPAGARLLIDSRPIFTDGTPLTTPLLTPLTWGEYHVSVQLDGYATVNPQLPTIQIKALETDSVEFTLEPRTIGREVGMQPFPFKRLNAAGDSIELSDFTGYVTLLNFWFVDCVPCMREFPDIEETFRERYDEGFRVLAVNRGDALSRIEDVRDQQGLTFQLILDPARQLEAQYRLLAYPTNIIIDRTGTIHEVLLGVNIEELNAQLDSLLQNNN